MEVIVIQRSRSKRHEILSTSVIGYNKKSSIAVPCVLYREWAERLITSAGAVRSLNAVMSSSNASRKLDVRGKSVHSGTLLQEILRQWCLRCPRNRQLPFAFLPFHANHQKNSPGAT